MGSGAQVSYQNTMTMAQLLGRLKKQLAAVDNQLDAITSALDAYKKTLEGKEKADGDL